MLCGQRKRGNQQEVESLVNETGLSVNLKHVGCVGMCHQVPLVEMVPKRRINSLFQSKTGRCQEHCRIHFELQDFLAKTKNSS